jgi:hypothetical protein
VSPGSTPNFNLPILLISLCLSPGKLSESSIVQTPHLCLQDSLPTSACRDILNAHLQASCRSLHLSKHLTCVSRTHSQLQPVEIYSSTSQKHVVSGNQLTSHISQMTLQPTCPKWKWNKNTSSESRILKLFDALCFTSAMYQPSVDCKSLVQAQHISLQKIRELNTNDSSFTLDGVLSTLQQGSAENGVGSSVELRYHVEKAPCTDLRSDPTLHPKFLQNYAGRRVRQPRTPN